MTGSEPFSAFMARALYDPQRGYYARHIRTVGARGDFSTAATLSPLLGRAIAAWLLEESRLQPQVRHIIEIGPGDGSLMAVVRKSLGWWQRRRFQFHLVETSPVLRARQQERLGRKVRWHEDMAGALRAADGQAFIYHNEVLDAFPVTLIQWQDGEWQEVYVGSGREELKPLTLKPTDSCILSDWQPQNGQRCELHVTVKEWLAEWAPSWQAGAMLTVDYGDVFPALYHRRPRGTLRAYLLQQRLEGAAVYENPGRQDITADVNFTDYRAWAQALGWEEAAYGTQAEFITARVKRQRTNADAFLLHEDGAGHAFKHVIHRRLRK
ncbi:MAG: SAM-dependent methyltransferase [Prosthecobacter sp.]|nr:SAM-dependent methyltransferase [Prosthecobacter sp.]